jgi:hypothetical protein
MALRHSKAQTARMARRRSPEISRKSPAKYRSPCRRRRAMRWGGTPTGCPFVQRHALQELQPIEQAVHVGRVLPDLKLTQPDKARDRAVRRLRSARHRAALACHRPAGPRSGIDPPLSSDKRIRAKALDDRDSGQDGLGRPALLDEAPRQILVRPGSFGRIFKPGLQVARPSASEHLVTVDGAQAARCSWRVSSRVAYSGQIIRLQSQAARPESG